MLYLPGFAGLKNRIFFPTNLSYEYAFFVYDLCDHRTEEAYRHIKANNVYTYM